MGVLALKPQPSPVIQLRQEAQVLLEVPAELRPELPVSGAAVRGAEGARRGDPVVEGDAPQPGELSGDDLLGHIVLPRQAWKRRGHKKKNDQQKRKKIETD